MHNKRRKGLFAEQGTVLINLVFLLSMAFIAYSIRGLSPVSSLAYRQQKTQQALEEAKQALIGWAALQATPGQLPCPEDVTLVGTLNEGSAKSSCNALPALGRLPWKSLGIGDIRDGNGDKLWYVISAGFRSSPINLNTQAQLSVDGVANAAVAIIFSAGTALNGQIRNSASATVAKQYLDLGNSDGDANFISTASSATFNDQLKLITKADLFKVVAYRVLGEIRGDSAQGLGKFYAANNVYAYADSNHDGLADNMSLIGTPSYQGSAGSTDANLFFSTAKKTMLTSNAWLDLIQYEVQADRKQVTLKLNGQQLQVTP